MIMHVQPHDALFRLVFSKTENAAALFRLLMPSALAAELEWGTLRAESGLYIDDGTLNVRSSDLLFSIRLRNHATRTMYLSAEHQSDLRGVRHFPFRILRYQTDIWSRDLRERANTNGRETHLQETRPASDLFGGRVPRPSSMARVHGVRPKLESPALCA